MTVARHYDGLVATARTVELHAEGALYRLVGEEGWTDTPFALADLFAIEAAPPRRSFGHREREGWRLHVDGPLPDGIEQGLPRPPRYGRWIDRFGLWRSVACLAPVAAGLVALVLHAPVWIAPSIPPSWENRLGDTMARSFDGLRCRTPQGQAALTALVRRLDPAGKVRSIDVVNDRAVNAITLPGGHVLLFQGLLEQATGPEEIAGVVGHEIGHVAHRDTMQALVREMGLGAVLGGFNGNVANATNASLSLAYGRDAEREADTASIAAMKAADISPAATAAFFERSARAGGQALAAAGWLSTHPLSDERRQRYAGAVQTGHAYHAGLDDAQWRALVNMCREDPAMRSVWENEDY